MPLQWSPCVWTTNGVPVAGCDTFEEGRYTGQGAQAAADSVDCAPTPDGWRWSVSIPGPYVVYYEFVQIPPESDICGAIFFRADQRELHVTVSPDRIIVRGAGMRLLYTGPYPRFDPTQAGFTAIQARRCGSYTTYPLGACCQAASGVCEMLSAPECGRIPGDHMFVPGGPCSPNPCPQPLGACCLADGTCVPQAESSCAEAGGQWLGIAAACDPNPCPARQGACCAVDGTCRELEESACRESGASWYGPAVACTPDPCPSPVPADRGSWGRVKSTYR